MDLMKPVSTSGVATTSTGDYTVPHCEITDYMDAGEKKVVRKSLTRIRTSVGALEESQFIGREKEIVKIMDLISNADSQKVEVISVWGMGGLGKTTLVSSVYQRAKLNNSFEKCVFVTVMRPFKLADFLITLVQQLIQESSKKDELLENSSKKSIESMGVDELTMQLKKLLEKKNCLIVLDDLFDISEWDLIKERLFPQLQKTSRIIVTTRKENIASHCSGEVINVYNLQVLEPEEALHLFSKKVFGKDTGLVDQNSELLKEGKQILKKCGGLPLAIVAIGGFLANRPKNPEEWRKLNKNINAELELNPELGMIRTVLEKSYDGLPYHLKSCFLYLSIFPEDQIISRRRLVHWWAVEGYATEAHGKSAIEIADNYFMELESRSMILPYQQSVDSRKSIDSCKVHDLIRDIAISKSVEENLVFKLEEGCSFNTPVKIRHLAISSNWEGDQSEFDSIVDMSRLRSLSLFGEWKPFFISDKMRFLRVLDLEGIFDLQYHDLDQIWKLIHLKYLSLRRCFYIELLPDSLGNLRQLQMLDVRDTSVRSLSKTISNLQKLQYIHAGDKQYFEPKQKDSLMKRCLRGSYLCATCCVPLVMDIDSPFLPRRDECAFACCVEFPAINRMGLDLNQVGGGALMPRGVKKLRHLHTLREVNVGRGSFILRDIGMLTGLCKLGVAGISKKNAMALCSAISKLRRLESLSVRSEAGEPVGLQGCLDAISSPPENLQSLKLYGNLETLPKWIEELQHLVKLELEDTRLLEHDAAMEFLGKLPKLEIVCLSGSSFEGEKLAFIKSPLVETAFRSLRVLRLDNIWSWNLKSVEFEEGTVPKLELLRVIGSVADEFGFSGLQFLPSINHVHVTVFSLWGSDLLEAAKEEDADKICLEQSYKASLLRSELKKQIQDQLAGHANQPIVTV